jgi:hypothetical protein
MNVDEAQNNSAEKKRFMAKFFIGFDFVKEYLIHHFGSHRLDFHQQPNLLFRIVIIVGDNVHTSFCC